MSNNKIKIRIATKEDAASLLKIYSYYVENTAITFEYEVPTKEEFEGRIKHTLSKYPYLVAEIDKEIVGYSYVSPFKERAAYDWGVETTIYVDKNKQKMGIGKVLYKALEDVLKQQNILNLNACIAYPEAEDKHLTKNSAQFHKYLGYDLVGEFHKCGYKFGKWYNMIWMEKHIGKHEDTPAPFKNFDEVREYIKTNYGIE